MDVISYQSGFGNFFSSEALPKALPLDQNSPQHVPYGLYAEQLSGSAFTAPRHSNLYAWLYRILPSVKQSRFQPYHGNTTIHPQREAATSPEQIRTNPLLYPQQATHFIDGLRAYAHASTQASSYLYAINTSMDNVFCYNADGDFLIVPQEGTLLINTEFGRLTLAPEEIAVIPRGIKFQVQLQDPIARGYVCENKAAPFVLPDLGPIGASGLANPRDFLAPTAHFHDKQGPFILITKFQETLWHTSLQHHPLDVVAWHGNYVPYKYDLKCFNTINTVSFDHPDPSIFTVLTSPSTTQGVANLDFVIFPPRWMVAEHTFRPPYFHRNIMSEFMGLIKGVYDAKQEGFTPGSCNIHNAMTPHGPDNQTYLRELQRESKPQHYKNTLAFMFESRAIWQATPWLKNSDILQQDYPDCWQDLPKNFKVEP